VSQHQSEIENKLIEEISEISKDDK